MRFVPSLVVEASSAVIGMACCGVTSEAFGVASALALIILMALTMFQSIIVNSRPTLSSWFVDQVDVIDHRISHGPWWLNAIASGMIALVAGWTLGLHSIGVASKVGIIATTIVLLADLTALRRSMKIRHR
ncbi:MAG: hypothetical protein ACP5HZ_10800 [Ferrimicrobium sp.]